MQIESCLCHFKRYQAITVYFASYLSVFLRFVTMLTERNCLLNQFKNLF